MIRNNSSTEFMEAYIEYLVSRPILPNEHQRLQKLKKVTPEKKKLEITEFIDSCDSNDNFKKVPAACNDEIILDNDTSIDIKDELNDINNVDVESTMSTLSTNPEYHIYPVHNESTIMPASDTNPQYRIYPVNGVGAIIPPPDANPQYHIYPGNAVIFSLIPLDTNPNDHIYPAYNYNVGEIVTDLVTNTVHHMYASSNEEAITSPSLDTNPAYNEEVSKHPQTTISTKTKKRKTTTSKPNVKKNTPKKNCKIVFENDTSIDIKDEPLRLNDDNSMSFDLTPPIQDEEFDKRSSSSAVMVNSLSISQHEDAQTQEDPSFCSQYEVINHCPKEKWPSNLWNRGIYNKIFYADPKITDEVFFEYCRILPHQFDILYNLVNVQLWAINSKKVESKSFIHPHVELAVTITFLTRGYSFCKLARDYCIQSRAIPTIISKVCKTLASALEPLYLTDEGPENWWKIADGFWEKTQFPHTVGCIQGKNLSNAAFNKSVILLASCDANKNFLWAILDYSETFQLTKSKFFQSLTLTVSSLPRNASAISANLKVPHFFVGSDAMPLLETVVTPYKQTKLSYRQLIFNRRLSAVTDTIEKSFDMLANRFWLYRQNYTSSSQTIMAAMKATISLYNFLRRTGEDIACPPTVESKLENVSLKFEEGVSEAAISHRNILTDYCNTQTEEIILIEDDSEVCDTDVILIE